MINVIYEDNHLLVVTKPVNVPVQGDDSHDKDLLTMLKDYLKEKYQKPGNVYLGLVHRLDRPVGGVMVFARTSKAAARLAAQMQKDDFRKTYLAVIQGTPDQKATLKDYLVKDGRTNTVRVTDKDHGKYAELDYRILKNNGELSLAEIHLKTGRSHQIRVQFSSRNWPLWGDQRYNPSAIPGQQIALWASSLTFTHPVTKQQLTFTSPQPEDYPWDLFD